MIRPITLGNALAVTSGIFFTVCSLFVAFTPTGMHSVGRAWYGGMGMGTGMGTGGMMQAGTTTWGAFFLGFIWLVIGAWLFGALLGFLYNRFGGDRTGWETRGGAAAEARESARSV